VYCGAHVVKENGLRTTIAGLLLGIILLQGCATGANKGDGSDGATLAENTREVYVSQEGLSSQQRFREALSLLEDGRPIEARKELELYLEQNPESDTGIDLLRQINLPSLDYFPEDYREVQLAPNETLSNLSNQYLGSIYQFFALAKYNGISQPDSLRAGQTIRIPLTDTARSAFAAQDSSGPDAKFVPAARPPPKATQTKKVAQPQAEATQTKEVVQPQTEDTPAKEVAQLHREALNAYRAQDLNSAIELWDEVLVIDPEHENARLYRAQAIELQTKLRSLN
jgi:hypothetical protein